METNTDQIFEIFDEAKRTPAGAEREGYLSSSCGADSELRWQVDALLLAHESAGDFLNISELQPPNTISTERPGDLVGRYKLIEQIGEGGCGAVYLAEQERPVRRRVALKIIKLGMDTREVVARFEAERQALALMDHPNIARVYDAGATDTGRPYFVMELVAGKKITDYCDEHQLTAASRLRLFVDVCHAIQHAHQKGIIHRDIKPSNVLVTDNRGVAVPKVIDFGIAKAMQGRLSEMTVFTQVDQFMGTPAYMSPEQAKAGISDIDTRADVYSLGVLLYALLTGQTPFDSSLKRRAGVSEIRRAIAATEPPKPSTRLNSMPEAECQAVTMHRQIDRAKLVSLVRGDLDWIVMKCLEKDRARRYQTASDLAADIQRHLGNEPIVARPPTAAYRLHKLWQRKKVAFAAVLAVASASVIAVAALAVSTLRIGHAQQTTSTALDAATEAKTNLEVDSYFHRVALAHRELSADNLGGALQFLAECPPRLRDWEWRYLDRLGRTEPVVLRHAVKVQCVAFHPDGKKIAAACGDGTVKIWDLDSRTVIQTLPCNTEYVFSVAFRPPDGRHLASAGADRIVRVWDWSAAETNFQVPGPSAEFRGLSNAIAYSADGTRLMADRGDGTVAIWNADVGKEISSLEEKHEVTATSIQHSGDGDMLATASWGGVLRLWNARTGTLMRRIREHSHRISGLCFEPDGHWLATSSFDRSIKIWDVKTGEVLRSWIGSGGLISALALSPDGRRLASCGVEDRMVKLWDPLTGREILSLRGHTAMGHGLTFSPDGQQLASCSHDGTVRIWDARPLTFGERMESRTCVHDSEVWSVAFSPDGQTLASGSWDNTARLWDAQSGRLTRSLLHSGSVFHVTFNKDGNLATSSLTRERAAAFSGWDVRSGQELFTLHEKAFPFSVIFDPTARYVLHEGNDFSVKVWDRQRREDLGFFGKHGFNVWAMAFSPDGRHLATGSSDGFIRLWEWKPEQIAQMQEPKWRTPAGSLGYGERVAFSAGGDRIFCGGAENSVQILDAESGKVLNNLIGHTGEVWAVALDQSGRWLASAGEDTTIRIWDVKTGKPRRTLRGHTGFVMSLAFSPDGLQLASGSRDHTVKFWDTTTWSESPNP